MITPIGTGVARKAASDSFHQSSDRPFSLTIGLTIANGDPIVLNPERLTQSVQTSCKLRTVVCSDKSRLPPAGDNPLVQEVSRSPTVERRGGHGFHPLGKWVDRYQEVTISIFVGGEGSSSVYTPSSKGGFSFIYPSQHFGGHFLRSVLLANGALLHAIRYILVHRGPPVVQLYGCE